MINKRQQPYYSNINKEKMIHLLAKKNHNFFKIFENEISVKDLEKKIMLVNQEKFLKIYLYNIGTIISLKKPYNYYPRDQMLLYNGTKWKQTVFEIEKISYMKTNRFFKQFKKLTSLFEEEEKNFMKFQKFHIETQKIKNFYNHKERKAKRKKIRMWQTFLSKNPEDIKEEKTYLFFICQNEKITQDLNLIPQLYEELTELIIVINQLHNQLSDIHGYNRSVHIKIGRKKMEKSKNIVKIIQKKQIELRKKLFLLIRKQHAIINAQKRILKKINGYYYEPNPTITFFKKEE